MTRACFATPRWLIALSTMFAVLPPLACGKHDPARHGSEESARALQPSAEPPDRADATTEVAIYFANKHAVETGDESKGTLIAETQRLAGGSPAELARAAVEALRRGPGSEEALAVFPPSVAVGGIQVVGDVAVIDLVALPSGGSLQERLFVGAVVKTLTHIPGIRFVRFVVQGQPVETLMGHISVDKPLSADDID